jgi:cysteine desulfurase
VGRGLTELWGNPSSVHRCGQAARHEVELARKAIAELIGARPREIVFTSGGTEAIDLAIRSGLGRNSEKMPVIVTTRVEHAAVRELVEDLEKSGAALVRWAPIDQDGVVRVEELGAFLEGARVASVQWVNNETGVIQPVERIAQMCRERGVLFHCDATQWVGKMPTAGPIGDYMTFSPHKFHGPKGVGVVWSRRGVPLRPAIHGTQELGRRGGTENVPGILGAGAAATEASEWLADASARERSAVLRDHFERRVLEGCAGAVVNGGGEHAQPRSRQPVPRIWNTTNIGFPRLEAEALLLMLSERGLYASAGAACSSGSLDPSPVLLAMGVPEEVAHGSLRFSLSRETTEAEIEEGVQVVVECVAKLRASIPVVG